MMMKIIILIIIVIVFIVISRIHTVKANSDGKKKKILQVFCGYLVVWKPQDNHKIKQARIYGGGLGGLNPPPPLGGPKNKQEKKKKKKKKRKKRERTLERNPFKCKYCEEIFNSSGNLTKHMITLDIRRGSTGGGVRGFKPPPLGRPKKHTKKKGKKRKKKEKKKEKRTHAGEKPFQVQIL